MDVSLSTSWPISDSQENIDWATTARLYDNLAEIPSFIATHRQMLVRSSFITTAQPSMLQQNQLKVYNYILQENDPTPIHMIVCGTGKSYLINCLKLLLQHKLHVCAPTGVAACNIDGMTLHSLFNLPTKGDFRDLEGQKLYEMQQNLIIDEMSMMGRKTFG